MLGPLCSRPRGNLAVAQGDLDAALGHFQQSKRIREQLAASDPSNATWQRDLSYSLTKLAQLHAKLGRWTQALFFAEQSLAIDERLAAMDPTKVTRQKDVQISRRLVEWIQKAMGD